MKGKKENPRNFECRVVIMKEEKDAYLQIHIASKTICWDDEPQIVEFNHIFISLELLGCELDEYSLTNTDSIAINNIVELNCVDSSELIRNAKTSVEVGTDNKFILSGSAGSENTKSGRKEKVVDKTVSVNDLRLSLESFHKTMPKWKVYQINETPLFMSINNSYKIAELATISESKMIELNGEVWVNKDGYKIKGKDSGKYPLMRPFQRRLWEKDVHNDLSVVKSVDLMLG